VLSPYDLQKIYRTVYKEDEAADWMTDQNEERKMISNIHVF
jgi:hypothetical protein